VGDDDTRQSAHSELQYLSNSLTTARVEQQKEENSNDFFIPSRATGYRLISRKVFALLQTLSYY
jgi:hypothetical protein